MICRGFAIGALVLRPKANGQSIVVSPRHHKAGNCQLLPVTPWDGFSPLLFRQAVLCSVLYIIFSLACRSTIMNDIHSPCLR
jgi:hypothetical protein